MSERSVLSKLCSGGPDIKSIEEYLNNVNSSDFINDLLAFKGDTAIATMNIYDKKLKEKGLINGND